MFGFKKNIVFYKLLSIFFAALYKAWTALIDKLNCSFSVLDKSISTISVSLKNLQRNNIIERVIMNKSSKISSDIGFKILNGKQSANFLVKYNLWWKFQVIILKNELRSMELIL